MHLCSTRVCLSINLDENYRDQTIPGESERAARARVQVYAYVFIACSDSRLAQFYTFEMLKCGLHFRSANFSSAFPNS